MPDDLKINDEEALRLRSLSRWANEGGEIPDVALPRSLAAAEGDASGKRTSPDRPSADGPPQTNAEIVQLKVRVIALENLLMALLSDATPLQLARASEMAGCITPRAGATPHRLTTQGAAHMRWLVERGQILRDQAHDPAQPAA